MVDNDTAGTRRLGWAKLFWIPGPDGRLSYHEICGRVSPLDVCGKTGYHEAGVFFLESRNLHMTPPQLKGSLCAVLLKNKNHGTQASLKQPWWRLCYCWKFLPDNDCLEVFLWKGPTSPPSKTNPSTGCVPLYFSCVMNEVSFSTHFEFRRLLASKVPLLFLNQVFGVTPDRQPFSFPNINPKDGCFQCNPNGPDKLLLPHIATKIAGEHAISAVHQFPPVPKTKYRFEPNPFQSDWTAYRREPVHPIICRLETRKRHRPKQFPAWTAPPTIETFHEKDQVYDVVYVEDTSRRLHTNHPGTVAMPFLQIVER